jgi:DNA polymerase (family X)
LRIRTNAEIADKLLSLAHLLAARKENPFKVKAYRGAAKKIRTLGDSLSELVENNADLTQYSGIGSSIAGVIRELVQTGTTRQIQSLESEVSPEVAAISRYPRLDPRRVLRIYKKLKISTLEELKKSLETGDIGLQLGPRLEQHVRRAFTEQEEMLLYEADHALSAVQGFLISECGVDRVEAVGDYRRRVEVVAEMHFLIETPRFPEVIAKLRKYGGRADLRDAGDDWAVLRLSSGSALKVTLAPRGKWGVSLISATGSPQHVDRLEATGRSLASLISDGENYPTEASAYAKLGLSFIPPELREGRDEIELAAQGRLRPLINAEDIRGELHAHSTSSDGADTLEAMADAARAKGLEYIGISDHSQSLKIARGLSIDRLRNQLRFIDKLNERLTDIQILKSAEVDILPDGSLDYPDDLLKELDYTVCSIHSRFGLGNEEQTNRILRAMDNRYFNFLGHATGRLILKRPGYEIDIDRVIEYARQNRCFFELNSTPDRLDLRAGHARLAREAGVRIAITTDAHSTDELSFIKYGIEQARRAGVEKEFVLNTMSWPDLKRAIQR